MRVSDRGVAFIAAHEGVVPAPYRDSVGVWTFGVGHTAAAGAPNPDSLPRGMPADLDAALKEVFRIFRRDLDRYAEEVRQAVKVPMAQREFDAAVSFHFNTGAIARATWVKRWNARDKAGASEAIMDWRKPVEIIPRREAEQRLFRTGDYGAGRANVWPVTPGGNVIWEPVRTLRQSDILALMAEASPPPFAPQPVGFWASIIAAIKRLLGMD